MNCEEVAGRLTDLMEGDLDEAEQAQALEHLASCSSCEAVLSETLDVVQLANDHGRVELSKSDRSRMLESFLGTVDGSTST